MHLIRLDFCDFHPGFIKTDNFFYNLLKQHFPIVLCDQPDYLIYAPFGHVHRLHECVKIFFTGESGLPDWNICDYALSCFFLDDPRHLRLPWYVLHGAPETVIKARDNPEQILASKTKFCSWLASNHHPRKNRNRAEFFHRLSKYKRVDSGGRYLNNIGGPVAGWSGGKIEFLKPYKFNMAFENASISGYTTEKIYEAMQARSLPIYWGNPIVGRDFNTRSFLNYPDFSSDEALIEKIIELDQDDAKYLEYVRQPYLPNDTPTEYFNLDRVVEMFEKIFTTPIRPVSSRKKFFHLGRWMFAKRNFPSMIAANSSVSQASSLSSGPSVSPASCLCSSGDRPKDSGPK